MIEATTVSKTRNAAMASAAFVTIVSNGRPPARTPNLSLIKLMLAASVFAPLYSAYSGHTEMGLTRSFSMKMSRLLSTRKRRGDCLANHGALKKIKDVNQGTKNYQLIAYEITLSNIAIDSVTRLTESSSESLRSYSASETTKRTTLTLSTTATYCTKTEP